MNRIVLSTLLIACLLALSACGDEDTSRQTQTDTSSSGDASSSSGADTSSSSSGDASSSNGMDTSSSSGVDASSSGDTSGGDTSGGDTSGGDTSGGDTSGGDTSGGDADMTDVNATCGDGLVEGSESCDDGNADDTDACLSDCTSALCGDGIIRVDLAPGDPGYESCDDGNNNNNDACPDGPNGTCQAALCGDGHIQAGAELCDDGNQANDDDCPDGVGGTCLPAACGDGFVNMLGSNVESCDDGNGALGDACPDGPNGSCITAYCGDGFLEAGVEQCDNGGICDDGSTSCAGHLDCAAAGAGQCNSQTDPVCTNTCQNAGPAVCGDGVVQAGEQCDDGNALNDDSCIACALAACGDGFVETGVETCDDGNGVLTDACPDGPQGSCAPAACGDGFVETGVESCDDGNANDTDTCSNACTINASCGNGVLDLAAGEECDQGTANSDTTPDDGTGSTCRLSCLLPSCGDAVVDYGIGEECDDGGTAPGDGCDASCLQEPAVTCGDGNLDIVNDELCDDGSQCTDGTDCTVNPGACGLLSDPSCGPRDGDGCDDACQYEPVGQTCGDGTQDALEKCDDSNNANGDGCNPTCNLLGRASDFSNFGGKGAIISDGTYLYASVEGMTSSEIVRIDIAACAAQRAAAPAGPYSACDDPTVAGTACAPGMTDACVLANTAGGTGTETLATDGDRLWYFDRGTNTLHEIDLNDPTYPDVAVAGSGAQGNCTGGPPDGVGAAAAFADQRAAVWYNGYLYLVDGGLHLLRRFDPVSGQVTTIAGTCGVAASVDGFGTNAQLGSPRYLTSDSTGNLFIADTNGNRLRTYNVASGYVGSLVGTNGAVTYIDDPVGANAGIDRARGITSDGTSVYWGEQQGTTVRQVEIVSTSVTTLVGENSCQGPVGGTGGTGIAPGACAPTPPNGWARLDTPWSLAYDYRTRSIYVLEGSRISRVE